MRLMTKTLIMTGAGLAVVLLLPGCKNILDTEAAKKLKADIGATTMTVFPTVIHRTMLTTDADSTERLAEIFTSKNLAKPAVVRDEVPLPKEWSSNQTKMFKASAVAFAEYVKTHPIQTAYAIQAEYLVGGNESVLGIHYYIVDKDGRIADVYGVNSHHPEFGEVNPKSIPDCTKVLEKIIDKHLKAAKS